MVFWTIDIKLDSLLVTDRYVPSYNKPLGVANRYVRLEVAPIDGSHSHAYVDSHPLILRLTTAGAIWIDNDRETWLELHPGKDADIFSSQ